MKALRDVSPIDLVLGDFRFTLRLAAEFLGIPHVVIVNGYFSPYYQITPELPYVAASKLPRPMRQNLWLRRLLRELILRYHARPYQRLCSRYQLKTRIERGFDIILSSTFNLLCDLPEFTPQKNLPDHYQFVGPILWEPEDHDQPLPDIFNGQKRPLIYLTLGTSGDDHTLRELIRIFKNSPYDLIVSTASTSLPELPDNVYAIPFVKASEVLKKASLMICHGGNGSIYQAIREGVPILCLTTFYDQECNGAELAASKILELIKSPCENKVCL